MVSHSTARHTIPTRRDYDPASEQVTIVADVLPSSIDDVQVCANRERVCLTLERALGTDEYSFDPPADREFTDDRTVIYHNGVVQITVETVRSSERSTSRENGYVRRNHRFDAHID